MKRVNSRRGMLLVVVLVIITVLGVLGTSFSYLMNADLDSVSALMNKQQARMAAEAGLDRAILLLRTDRLDMDKWYNNPRSFRRILVWAPDKIGGSESLADQEKVEGRDAWRFSIVSNEQIGEQTRMRYGMTDECSRLNINLATREQLLALFDELVRLRELELGPSRVEELADAIIDWRDADDNPNSPDGAESDYYIRMEPEYRAKNRPFETIEELLMVKGFNGRILYGEDQNRNGYLDPNEDDGEEGAFPPDNGDGILSRGILPYITVYSWDFNTGMDNKYKVNINALRNASSQKLPKQITDEIDPAALEFISQALQRGYRFKSVGELLGLEVYEDGSSNYDVLWRQYASERRLANRVGLPDTEESAESDGQDGGIQGLGGNLGAGRRDAAADGAQDGNRRDRNEADNRRDDNNDGGRNRDGNRTGNDRNSNNNPTLDEIDREIEELRRQEGGGGNQRNDVRRRSDPTRERGGPEDDLPDPPNRNRGAQDNPNNRAGEGENNQPGERRSDRRRGDRNAQDGNGPDESGNRATTLEDDRRPRNRRDDLGPPGLNNAQGQVGGAGGEAGGGRSRGQPLPNPITAAMMPVLMDRLTTISDPVIGGLINVNTAPAVVLGALPGLTRQDAAAIVAQRLQMAGEDKKSPAWLVKSGVLGPDKFAMISNLITTRSIQYSLDIIGFADHVGAMARLQAVVEIRGQLSQIKYVRDISSLGLGYPVWDDQRSEGFGFNAR